jgi:diguanylate cyclase (GGDEF)-like protein
MNILHLWDRFLAGRAFTAVFSADYRRRMRLLQWAMAGTIYLGAGLVMWRGVGDGWVRGPMLAGWVVFVTLGLLAALVAIRSGWSERLRDPGLTEWQIAMGFLAVDWGYLMCGPLRTAALLPLPVILAFGAFTLGWRRIMALAGFAVGSLAVTMALLDAYPAFRGTWPAEPPPIERVNLLMTLVLMPALAVIAARLSSMRMRLRAQRHQLSGELDNARRMAAVDELTGLANRRALMECLSRFQRDAERTRRPFAVAVIDIDHFKQVNDSLGHATGDALLRKFARIALESTRAHDIAGRWGGEEFLFLVRGGEEVGLRVLERMQRRAAAVQLLGRPVTFSAGLAVHRAGESALDTVARADEAMYEAKHAGRNRVVSVGSESPA